MSVGDNIKAIRLVNQVLLKTLAALTGLTTQALINLEKGRHQPRIETLQRIAKALDTHIALFFAEKLYLTSQKPEKEQD